MEQLLDLNEAYSVVEAPSDDIEVLTLTDLQAQCRVDSVDEAELLKQLLAAAIDMLEEDTLLRLRPQRLALKLDRFPCGATPIELNRLPIAGDVTISYVDVDGEDQELIVDTDFLVDEVSKPGRILPITGTSWPLTESRPHAVGVEFDCGFAAGAVPPRALQALRLLVGHWFMSREAAAERSTKEIELSYTRLVEKLAWKA